MVTLTRRLFSVEYMKYVLFMVIYKTKAYKFIDISDYDSYHGLCVFYKISVSNDNIICNIIFPLNF